MTNNNSLELLEKYFDTAIASSDGIQRLRELILSLAMQGKLVPQYPTDQPASELLKEIEKKKKKLLTENKVKYKTISENSDIKSMQYQIPDSWGWFCFKDVVFFQEGPGIRNWQFTNAGIKLLNVSNILSDGKLNFSNSNKYVAVDEFLEKYTHFEITEGDLLFASSGGSWGKIAWYQSPGFQVMLNTSTIRLRFFNDNFEPDYLYYFLKTAFFRKQMEIQLVGMQPNFGSTHLNRIYISIPPINEQRRIVKKIDFLMTQCDELEKIRAERDKKRLIVHSAARDRLLNAKDDQNSKEAWDFIRNNFSDLYSIKENVNELRKAILQLAVMGKLVPQDPNDPPASELLKEIEAEKERLIKEKKIKKQEKSAEVKVGEMPYQLPKGWKWVRAIDILDIGTGSTPTKANSQYYGGNIPWYTSSSTNNLIAKKPTTFITEKALQETNCKVFPSGSLIIALYGQGKTRGQISEILVPGATNQAIAAMVFFEASKDIKKYLKYYFVKIYDEIRTLAEGGAQPNLSVGKIKNTLIPLPPLIEQHRIVAKVEQLMALCDRLEQQIDQSTNKQTDLLNAVIAKI